jgi:hypothetical protein
MNIRKHFTVQRLLGWKKLRNATNKYKITSISINHKIIFSLDHKHFLDAQNTLNDETLHSIRYKSNESHFLKNRAWLSWGLIAITGGGGESRLDNQGNSLEPVPKVEMNTLKLGKQGRSKSSTSSFYCIQSSHAGTSNCRACSLHLTGCIHTESGVFRGPKTGGVYRQSSLVMPEDSRTVASVRISSACWHASSPVSCDTNWYAHFY